MWTTSFKVYLALHKKMKNKNAENFIVSKSPIGRPYC